jgi:hypothetical protein
LSKVEKELVVFVSADVWAWAYLLDDLAVRQVTGEQFPPVIMRQPEPWIAEDAGELSGGVMR